TMAAEAPNVARILSDQVGVLVKRSDGGRFGGDKQAVGGAQAHAAKFRAWQMSRATDAKDSRGQVGQKRNIAQFPAECRMGRGDGQADQANVVRSLIGG